MYPVGVNVNWPTIYQSNNQGATNPMEAPKSTPVVEPLDIPHDIVDVAKLKSWDQISPREIPDASQLGNQEKIHQTSPFPYDAQVNKKVALWIGDLSCLNAHAIVNSTNESLNERNPLTERILQRAGPSLKACLHHSVKICKTGEAKMTKGYDLPARYVIHTVGPKYNAKYQTAAENALYSCYARVLQIVREQNLRTLGLCAINSTRRGYPPHEGAHIALRTVRRFIEKHSDSVDLIVFAVDGVDVGIYDLLMPLYYPRSKEEEEYALYYLPSSVGGKSGEPFIAERQIRIVDKPIHEFADDSVDLAAELDSSVCIGNTAFARMQGDVDKSRKKSHSEETRPTPDVLTQEVQRKNRYERLLRRARTEDFRAITSLKCLYQHGEDRLGRPIIYFIGQRFNYLSIDLDKAILYLINLMDPIVQKDYVVVYFHTMTGKHNHPSLNFVREVYNLLEYKYKKNLKSLYIVHPTFWTRLYTWWFTTFSASNLKNKVHTLGGVEYLYYYIAPEQLDIPQFIMDYDYRVNGARYCQITNLETGRPL